jgi:hypothetical protein
MQKMNRIFFIIFLAIIFTACQNQTSKNDNKSDKIELKPVNEKVFIELGGNKQYIEITGPIRQRPCFSFSTRRSWLATNTPFKILQFSTYKGDGTCVVGSGRMW